MKGFGFIPGEYKDIARQPFGSSFLFLILLALAIAFVLSAATLIGFMARLPAADRWVDRHMDEVLRELPEIEIKNGALVKPETTYSKQIGDILFGVFMSQQEARAALDRAKNAFVLTRDTVYTKNTRSDAAAEIKENSLRNVSYFSASPFSTGVHVNFENSLKLDVTRDRLKKWARILPIALFPVAIFFLFVMQIIAKTFQLFVFSIASLVFKGILDAGLTYPQLLNIGIYALVPASSVAVVYKLAGVKVPGFPVVYALVCLTFLFLGIQAAKGGKESAGAADVTPPQRR